MDGNYKLQARFGTSSEVSWIVGVALLVVDTLLGKRYNALRKRIDSWSYDVDQLLFGTILFTLVAFLFPTTVTYYTLFALVSGPHISDKL